MLGLCSDYSDITDITNRTCEQQDATDYPGYVVSCNFTVANMRTFRDLSISFGYSEGHVYDKFRSILDDLKQDDTNYQYERVDVARLFTIRVVGEVTSKDFLDELPLEVPATEVTRTNWYWCQHNYTNVSTDGHSITTSRKMRVKKAPLLIIPTNDGPTKSFASAEELSQYPESSLQIP